MVSEEIMLEGKTEEGKLCLSMYVYSVFSSANICSSVSREQHKRPIWTLVVKVKVKLAQQEDSMKVS